MLVLLKIYENILEFLMFMCDVIKKENWSKKKGKKNQENGNFDEGGK
jgi:hypothetical protein